MRKNTNTIGEQDIFLWVNIMMAGVVLLLLFHYVVMANSIASKDYKVQILRDKLSILSETNGILMAEKFMLESPAAMIEFAKSSNLVEAKNISYIFENKNVAQR